AKQIARAAFEGVSCSMLDCLDALERSGVTMNDRRIVLLGGGARSQAYRRVLADLSGREIVVPDEAEHVAAGACVQAAATLVGCSPREIAREWKLGRGMLVTPDLRID